MCSLSVTRIVNDQSMFKYRILQMSEKYFVECSANTFPRGMLSLVNTHQGNIDFIVECCVMLSIFDLI